MGSKTKMLKNALFLIGRSYPVCLISRPLYKAALKHDARNTDPDVVVDGGFRIKRDLRSLSVLRDPFGLHGFSDRSIYEPEVRQAIREILAEGGIAVDVGANIGYHTVLMSSLADQVIAVEPDPTNLELLKYNLERNACKNVSIIPCAVSDISKNCKLYLNSEDTASHSIVEQHDVCIDVRAVRLDEILPIGPIRLIKMDIEGGEYDAILGLGDRLNDIDNIIFENRTKQFGDPKQILVGFKISRLKTHNYLASRLDSPTPSSPI